MLPEGDRNGRAADPMKHHAMIAGGAVLAVLVLLGLAFLSPIRTHLPSFGSGGETPAVQALRSQAAHGDAGAQNDLGASYESGAGVGLDNAQAALWYRKAADQGLAVAENNLGRLYARGQGVQQNYIEAMKWFQKAAVQGDGEAMNNIGRLYGEGDGVSQDKVEALKWLYRASARYGAAGVQEPGYARENREGLAATMTPAQIAEAQGLANLASIDDDRPPWVSNEELAHLSKMGIDPIHDVVAKGNYHWSWRARRGLSVSTYFCPTGSTVTVSRTLVLVAAPKNSLCQGEQGAHADMLKLLPDGSAEQFPG
jgi:hypothetical protein